MKKTLRQLLFAYGFLTAFPGLGRVRIASEETGGSTLFYPIVGLTIGVFFYPIAQLHALSPLTMSILMCVFVLAVTRALHADGLIDTFDGFLSGKHRPEEVLKVMKDSRLGAMGFVLSFCLYLVKIAFFYEILQNSAASFPRYLVAAPVLSRGGVAIAGAIFPPAGKKEGLGREFIKSIGPGHAVGSFVLTAVIACLLARPPLYGAVLLICIAGLWALWGIVSKKKIGGINGDTIGAGIELTEVGCLILMRAFFR
jgi:cobalamin 5'-phosphate synthase/cobalamin synthase